MANPTSNFGWQMPTNTDLVKDLPADFETFGQAVDSDLADLKGGTTGQVLSKNSDTDMDFAWVTSDDANAIQNAIVDAKGDLITATAADTPARLAVGNDGETIVADSAATTGLRWQPNFSVGKNKVINGAFDIWQRGTSFTLSNGVEIPYTDRFRAQCNFSAGSASVSQQTFTPGAAPVAGYEGQYFSRLTCGSTTTYAQISQKIEDVRTLAGQTITVSAWVRATTAATVQISTVQNFGNGGSSAVAQYGSAQSLTSSWVRYSQTLTMPSISGKTIGSGSLVHLYIEFSGTLNSANVDVWGVQVEAGSLATPFTTATGTLQGETALCQRYYYRAGGLQTNQPFAVGWAASSSVIYALVTFPVTMRVAPTSVEYANLQANDLIAGGINFTTLSLTSGYGGNNMQNVTLSGLSGLTARNPYQLVSNGTTNGYLGFSAEL